MSYASLADARAEGVTEAQANDVRLQRLLDDATELIDTLTGWWFSARSLTLPLDGSGAPHLHLPAPIVSLTSVTLCGTALTLTAGTGDVIVYGSLTDPMSERRNPKLVRRSGGFSDPRRGPKWPRGAKNVVLVGSFGMTDSTGSAPPREIREVCLRLAIRSLALLTSAGGQAERHAGDVVKEQTDGHSYELAGAVAGAAGSWRRNGWTGDPDIDTVLMRWRAPISGGVA